MDIFWIKDKPLANLDHLPTPDDLAADIIEILQNALESFRELQVYLKSRKEDCKQIALGGNENDNRINASIAFKR